MLLPAQMYEIQNTWLLIQGTL